MEEVTMQNKIGKWK